MITLEKIRSKCGYEKLDNLRQSWKILFPGDDFPEKDTPLQEDKAVALLTRMSKPYAGRKEEVIQGAKSLLLNLTGSLPENIETHATPKVRRHKSPALKPPPPSKPEPEIMAETDIKPAYIKWSDIVKWAKIIFSISDLAAAYFICIGLTVYSLVYFFGLIGFFVGVLYFITSKHIMKIARDKTKIESVGYAKWFAVFMEFAAFFVHFPMLNAGCWKIAPQIPYKLTDIVDGELVNTAPGIFAICISIFILSVAIYCVLQAASETSEDYFNEFYKTGVR